MKKKCTKRDLSFLFKEGGFSNNEFFFLLLFTIPILMFGYYLFSYLLSIITAEQIFTIVVSIATVLLGLWCAAFIFNDYIIEPLRRNKRAKHKQQLTATPPEIGSLSNLKKLDLRGTQLATIPPEVGNLSNLEELNLSFNPLTAIPPEIGELKNLKKLHISRDQHKIITQDIDAMLSKLGIKIIIDSS
jgi:hypothetical protein